MRVRQTGTVEKRGGVGRYAALLALVCVGVGAGAVVTRADQTRANVPVVLFDVALDATPPDGGPDAMAIAKAAGDSVRASLLTINFDPTSYNPESSTMTRAVGRAHTVGVEDLAQPDKLESAQKIAAAYGARYVLFPHVRNMILSLEDGQARVDVALRVVPDLGPEKEVLGIGTAKLKPAKRSKTYATRLLQQAIESACGEAAKQLAGPADADDATGQGSAARSYFTDGLQRLRQNRLTEALALLERATHLDPHNVEYSRVLADTYQRSGQIASALMEYRRAVTIEPNSIDLRVRLARIYLARSMVKEASAELRRASQIDPDHAEVRSALIEVYLRNNMLEEAVAEYRRLATAKPDDPAIHLALGDLQLRRGILDEATEEYRRAAALSPQDPGPHQKLAELYRKRDMHREALREMILAQRMPAGADDAERYREIADALDHEAAAILNDALKALADRKTEQITREDAYTRVKALAERADALTAEIGELKAPATLTESHRRRAFSYSLLAQSLVAYRGFYESASEEDSANADLLQTQAVSELKRARVAMGTP